VGKTVDEAALRVAVSVHPEYLETAFSVIREAHGSLDGYLEDALGRDGALRDKLTRRLPGLGRPRMGRLDSVGQGR